MSSAHKNLSAFAGKVTLKKPGSVRVGIVTAEWNTEVTSKLLSGALITLQQSGITEKNIMSVSVPGSFELPLGADMLIRSQKPDAVICLGCIIQGETRHFDFISQAVADGITRLNLDHKIPVIFGVLTPDNQKQAMDRAGGKHGNKGDEAAYTALKMIELNQWLKPSKKG